MTEVESIKDALVNVITLATHSDYYNKDRDDKDIDLITEIVKKEIPQNPEPYSTFIKTFEKGTGELKYMTRYDGFSCPTCGHELTNDERKKHDNYCPKCGQRIDWEEGETE